MRWDQANSGGTLKANTQVEWDQSVGLELGLEALKILTPNYLESLCPKQN